jgi:Hypervirulence associated proteins TUDOR domain
VKGVDVSKEFKPGDKVSWNTSKGATHGTVERKVAGTQRVKGHVAKASPDDPEYRVRSDKSGKEAVHRPEALRKE